MFKLYVLLLIFLNWSQNVYGFGEQTLVDQLTNDYLMAEKDLWVSIEKREDSTLQQIYNVHTQYLNRFYGESNVFLNAIYLNSNPVVVHSIIAINQTSHEIATEFFEHRNYSVLSLKAIDGLKVYKIFDDILKETINSTEFWINVKNVCIFTLYRKAWKNIKIYFNYNY